MLDYCEVQARRDAEIMRISLLIIYDARRLAEERILDAARALGVSWRNIAGRVIRYLEKAQQRGLQLGDLAAQWVAEMKRYGVNMPRLSAAS